MPASDYTASSGALKLKGAAGITKKRKKKPKSDLATAEAYSSSSKKTSQEENTEAEKTVLADAENVESDNGTQAEIWKHKVSGGAKTEAEIRFEEKRRKRLEEQLRKDGSKTHKERVEDLNRYLSKLSEHHDMCVELDRINFKSSLTLLGRESDLAKTICYAILNKVAMSRADVEYCIDLILSQDFSFDVYIFEVDWRQFSEQLGPSHVAPGSQEDSINPLNP